MRPNRCLSWPKMVPFLATALSVLALPSPGYAWECGRVLDTSGAASGPALFWANRAIPYAFNARGTTMLSQSDAEGAIRAAFAVWQQSQLRDGELADCPNEARAALPHQTDIQFVEGARTEQDYVGYNYLSPTTNRNIIVFRDTDWPHPYAGPSSDYAALSTVTYNVTTGEILDADLEFNTAGYNLTVGDTNVAFDLLSIAVHEVGHLLGFGHSKNDGASMGQTTLRTETTKRRLSCDDAAILWYRYPAGLPTSTCAPRQVDEACGFCAAPGGLAYDAKITVQDTFNEGSGCHCAGAQAGYGAGLTVLTLIGRAFRRRRADLLKA